MDDKSAKAQDYLVELYQMTEGDAGSQVSMFDVGAEIGLDKAEAGKIAEDLIGDGLAQVKTLSGGIGITTKGIEKVQVAGLGSNVDTSGLSLGVGPVIDDAGRKTVATIAGEVQTQISKNSASYDQLEEMVIDLKTIEVQLLSPKPKTEIIRQVLRSLQSALETTGGKDLSEKIGNLIAQ